MNRKYIFFIAILAFLFGCQEDPIENPLDNKDSDITKSEYSPALSSPYVKKGTMIIKFKRAHGEEISIASVGETVESNIAPLNTMLSNVKAKGMRRLFPYAGKYEKRTRKEGLHLWYVVDFDENVLVASALSQAQQLQEVEVVEPEYQIALPKTKVTSVDKTPMADEKYPFDDPRLFRQWHYRNLGTNTNFKKGADINLFEAWKEETGKPNVIVCIVDGGVDFEHEDLIDNMHVNLKEKNGKDGVDDDGNGYIDDVYGFNFINYTANIVPDDSGHGTHVAGTVAARNNNGIGVCGVAGGNGATDSGIRMISAQIFKGEYDNGNSVDAIKYGADNGAVISQNSWGFPYKTGLFTIPRHLKDAIDYFIKYAGCDNNGNQLPDSPMKGGVMIFAAGNDGKEFTATPAYYEPVISVTSMAPNFEKAWYSNYGTWADIMAPGGDRNFYGGEVYSTLPRNRYGYMDGTSMACPHVSGVAALVVSKFGGQGFTNEDLRKHLLGGLRPVNIDEKNPKYIGKMGVGYIDAKAALQPLVKAEDNKNPKTPQFVEVKPDFTGMTVVWKATSDENDGTPTTYKLYYSKEKLTNSNYKQADLVKVSGIGYEVGTAVSYEFKELPLDTELYFAVEAVDRWGAVSGVSFTSGKTKENHPPILKRENDTPIRIKGQQKATLKVLVNEPDGHKWTYLIKGFKRGVNYKKVEDGIVLDFQVAQPLGKHSLRVIVRDVFKATAEIEIPFEYYKNYPPVLDKEFEKVYAPIKKAYTIDLSTYFSDPEKGKLTFDAKSSVTSVSATVEGNILTVTPAKLGIADIKIIAKDAEGAEGEAVLRLQAVNDDIVYLVYPIPVTKTLNIQFSNEVTSAKVKVRTLTGKTILEKTVEVSDGNRRRSFNLSKVSGGTYVLEVTANGKKFTQTFVKY